MAIIGKTVLLGFGDVAMLGGLVKKSDVAKIKFCDTLGVRGNDKCDVNIDQKSDTPPIEIVFDLESGKILLEMMFNMVIALEQHEQLKQTTS